MGEWETIVVSSEPYPQLSNLPSSPNAPFSANAQKAIILIEQITGTALQDGLLAYYTSQAPLSDANIEKRLDTEPYQWPYGPEGRK